MITWQPLDTAPMNGKHIMLGLVGFRHVWIGYYGAGAWVHENGERCKVPTHWRPLPAPPSAAAAPPAPASRATSAPAQDAGPAGVTEEMVDRAGEAFHQHGFVWSGPAMRDALEAAARTPDAGKETGR